MLQELSLSTLQCHFVLTAQPVQDLFVKSSHIDFRHLASKTHILAALFSVNAFTIHLSTVLQCHDFRLPLFVMPKIQILKADIHLTPIS